MHTILGLQSRPIQLFSNSFGPRSFRGPWNCPVFSPPPPPPPYGAPAYVQTHSLGRDPFLKENHIYNCQDFSVIPAPCVKYSTGQRSLGEKKCLKRLYPSKKHDDQNVLDSSLQSHPKVTLSICSSYSISMHLLTQPVACNVWLINTSSTYFTNSIDWLNGEQTGNGWCAPEEGLGKQSPLLLLPILQDFCNFLYSRKKSWFLSCCCSFAYILLFLWLPKTLHSTVFDLFKIVPIIWLFYTMIVELSDHPSTTSPSPVMGPVLII